MKTLDGKRGRPVQELGLLKEAIITGQLTHPGIPPVYDLDEPLLENVDFR